MSYYRVDHRFRAYILEQSAGADGFVVGGGQLITGNGTFFAHRLATIAAVARERNIPLFIQSVGVSDPANWQEAAAVYLQRAFGCGDNVVWIATRDRVSADHWTRAFGGRTPAIARDPGLLAADVYADAIGARKSRTGKEVGVGLISANVVGWFGHAPDAIVKPSIEFFVDTGRYLVEAGHRPVYFTNGSGEDEAVLETLADHVALHSPELYRRARFEQRPRTPTDLVRIIAGLDGLIAHRLHANIVAYAFGIPHVGLGWDDKLASFFESVGRERYLLGAGGATGEDAVRLAEKAMSEGIAARDHDAVIEDAWKALGSLARHMQHIGQDAHVA